MAGSHGPTLAKIVVDRMKLWRAFRRGRTELDYPPLFLWIEPTSRCNLKCPMCPQSEGLKIPYGFMPVERFRSVADKAAGLVQIFSLHFSGESTLNKDLPEMVRYAADKGVPTILHSNGTVLKREGARKLIEAGLDQIVFSFDAIPEEEYEIKRAPAKLPDTLEKIRGFLREKKELESGWPIVTIKSLVFDSPGSDPKAAEKIREWFEGLPVDRFAIERAHTFAGAFGKNVRDTNKYEFMGHDAYFGCALPWYGFVVGWDGTAYVCCNDLNGEGPIGHIEKQSVMEIWNGGPMRRLREGLVRGGDRLDPLCASCDAIWRDFNGRSALREGLGFAAKFHLRKRWNRKRPGR